jgi:hypothetical protein
MRTTADRRSADASLDEVSDAVAHVLGERVAGLRTVQGDPADTVLDAVGDELGERTSSVICSFSHGLPPGGLSMVRSSWDDERVEGDRSVGADDERVDVELGDVVGEVERETLDLHDRVDERVEVGRCAPRTPSSSGKPRTSRIIRCVSSSVERRDPEGHVGQHLHEHPAEPEHDGRPEQVVLADADDRLHAAVHELGHEHALDVGIRAAFRARWSSSS